MGLAEPVEHAPKVNVAELDASLLLAAMSASLAQVPGVILTVRPDGGWWVFETG
jgi:hypothetical protein